MAHVWMAAFAQVNFTLEIYSKVQFSGNVWRKKKTDGTGDFSVGCSFPPSVTQMGSIHSNRSTNCAAILVTGLPQRQENQSRVVRKRPEQWIYFS